MYKFISSRANPLLLETAKLKEKKYRERSGAFLFEGIKLFREALSSAAPVRRVFVSEELLPSLSSDLRALDAESVIVLSMPAYEKISTETAPQGILTVCGALPNVQKGLPSDLHFSEEAPGASGGILMLHAVRDPGNLGACLRSAAAFGVERMIISSDCAELYSPKTVRAAMGALFRTQVSVVDAMEEAVRALRRAGRRVYGAALGGGVLTPGEVLPGGEVCYLVGNEGHGLPEALLSLCGGRVMIPMTPGSESLNAAVAASVLLWENNRNRLNRSLDENTGE